MRFLATGEWKKNRMMRLILGLFLVYMFFFWITNWVLWTAKFSFDPSSIAVYYAGDPAAEFGQPPRPVSALAEQSHMHLFAMGLLVLTLTHLLLFLPFSLRWKGTLVVGTFLSALVEEGSSWLIRFVHPGFAWLKLGSFVALQLLLGGLVLALLVAVVRPRAAAAREAAASGPSDAAGRQAWPRVHAG